MVTFDKRHQELLFVIVDVAVILLFLRSNRQTTTVRSTGVLLPVVVSHITHCTSVFLQVAVTERYPIYFQNQRGVACAIVLRVGRDMLVDSCRVRHRDY